MKNASERIWTAVAGLSGGLLVSVCTWALFGTIAQIAKVLRLNDKLTVVLVVAAAFVLVTLLRSISKRPSTWALLQGGVLYALAWGLTTSAWRFWIAGHAAPGDEVAEFTRTVQPVLAAAWALVCVWLLILLRYRARARSRQ